MCQKYAGRLRSTFHRFNQCLLLGSLLWLMGCAEETASTEEFDPTTTIEEYTVTSVALATDTDDEDVAALVRLNNDLALGLFQYSQRSDSTSNDMLAAYGLSQLLAMSAVGVAGTTAEEYLTLLDTLSDASLDMLALPATVQRLNRLLNENADDNGGASLFNVTNNASAQMGYRFHKDYLNTLIQAFDAQLDGRYFTPAPVGAPPPSFLSPIVHLSDDSTYADPQTRLSLRSKTELTHPWNLPAGDRFEGLFEGFDGIQQWVPMLRWQGDFNVYADDALSASELPLGDSGKALLMITPAQGRYSDVSNNLSQHLAEMIPALLPQETTVYLPEFSASGYASPKSYLQLLGVSSAFVEGDGTNCGVGCRADFSAVNGLGYLYLSSPEQTASITVDGDAIAADSEDTLELLAAKDEPPGVWFGYDSSGSNSTFFSVLTDFGGCTPTYVPEGTPQARPFLFVIRDVATNAILYLGQVRSLEGREAGSWECLSFSFETLPVGQ